MTTLFGRRVMLRPLASSDFSDWQEVRRRNVEWLTRWEPARSAQAPDPVNDRQAFAARCGARDRERQLGTGFGFGIFVTGDFAGEININNVVRGAFQSAHVGYWIDEKHAGNAYMSEALVVLFRHVFEQIGLHRLQISIIPRNTNSHRVVEKLGLRNEGLAERYLEINGVWEDHLRYALTIEEWNGRRDELLATWIGD